MILPTKKNEHEAPLTPFIQKETLKKQPAIINMQGFGKAGNNAIDILIAAGHFSKENVDLKNIITVYKELTKKIYNADLECVEEIKNGE